MHVRKKRRQLRYEVKKGLKSTRDDNIQSVVVRARRFGIFDAEDFEIQVDGWLSQDEKDIAEKVKTSRDFNKFLHTLGLKRIAQEKDIGETLNQCDMFMVTHTKKDENPVNELAGEAMAKIKTIIDNQLPTERVCSQGSIYWSSNNACGQVLGREHSGRVCRVGLGPTPGKFTSYTSSQGSISSAPPLREQAMTIEMESLKSLCKSQNIKLQEQSAKLQEQSAKLQEQSAKLQEQSAKHQEQNVLFQAQQEELAAIKRMVQMIIKGKQSSIGNNQEGEPVVVEDDDDEIRQGGA